MNINGLVRRINKQQKESVFLFGQHAESCQFKNGRVLDMRGNVIDTTLGFIKHHLRRPQYIANAAELAIDEVKAILESIDENDTFWE